MSTAAIAYELDQPAQLPRTLPGFGQRVTARRAGLVDEHEMIVDIFAGAGGASLGIEAALGRCVDRAINHNPLMIQMHEANHPGTVHLPGDVWEYKPLHVTQGRPVGLLWASPDCRHFSRAKGGVPVSPKVRALAWVVIRWAREVRPRVIILENVPEFQTWGPLDSDCRPIPEKKGETFRRWLRSLERAGYTVEHRELVAADFGVPTIRKRFFLIARCDGEAITWPEQTHAKRQPHAKSGDGQNRHADRQRRVRTIAEDGQPQLLHWRSAASCIDWSLRCPSIFERKKPLAEATQRRIARGIQRYVIAAPPPGPFIVTCNHAGAEHRTRPVSAPMDTITAKGDTAIVAPTLIQTGYGERDGQSPRVPGIDKPLGTVVAGGVKHAVVGAFIAKHYGGPRPGRPGSDLIDPLATITAVDHHSLVTAAIDDARDHAAEVRAFLIAYYGQGSGTTGRDVREPIDTIVGRDRFGVVTVDGHDFIITDMGLRMLAPRELLRAQFDRFADDYVLIGTQAQQVAGIGNSVPPELAELLVKANVRIKRLRREEAA